MTQFWKKLMSGFVVVSALSMTACNTIEGAGQDIESAGETIEETADNAKD